MQKIYKAAIIGGGASGLMAAVELLSGKNSFCGADVLLLERNDRVGKKLIATGNGQGNLMNANFSPNNYRGERSFVSTFIDSAEKINLENYLFNLGIPLCTLKDGKKYPLSRQASAVLDIIRSYLSKKDCQIQTDCRVTKVAKTADYFTIYTEKDKFFAKSVIMATGGMAAKQFGTDGTAYALAQNFGHKLTPLYPSLVQIKTETQYIKGLKGLKETARVTAYSNGEKMTATGDLLFTDYGVSGNTIFQVSAILSGKKDERLDIEFLPELTESEIIKLLESREVMPHINKEDVLCGILNKRIGQAVIKRAKSDDIKDIAAAIKHFTLKVTGNTGFNYAQVTKGGISTAFIDENNMQSKLVSGFYVVGEALDVDGDCGGYNVTFAFVSGIMAARSIKGV